MAAELACYTVEKLEKDKHIYETTAKLEGRRYGYRRLKEVTEPKENCSSATDRLGDEPEVMVNDEE